MASFFLGRWVGLGSALIGDGFAGHQTAYIDCPVVAVMAAGNVLVATSASGSTVAPTEVPSQLVDIIASANTATTTDASADTTVTVQSGCEG